MQCPYCSTINRDDQETCYHCGKDISILRLIVNKARHHYNLAIEHAERGRLHEAKTELQNAIDLDRSHVKSWLALGTVFQRLGDFDNAQACWNSALAIDPDYANIHDYLIKSGKFRKAIPVIKRLRLAAIVLTIFLLFMAIGALNTLFTMRAEDQWRKKILQANEAILAQKFDEALRAADGILVQSPPEDIKDAALIIRNSVHRQIQFYFEQIERLNSQQRYGEALEIVDKIRRLSPDSEVLSKVEYLQQQIIRPQMVNQIEDKLQIDQLDWRDFTLLSNMIADYTRFFTAGDLALSWQSQLDEHIARRLNSDLAGIQTEFVQAFDISQLEMNLTAIEYRLDKIPGLKPSLLERTLQARLDAIQLTSQAAEDFLAAGRIADAERLLEALTNDETLNSLLNQSAQSSMGGQIAAQKNQIMLEILNAAILRMDWPAVDRLSTQLGEVELSTAASQTFVSLKSKAASARAESYLQWFASHQTKLQRASMDDALARDAIGKWEFLKSTPNAFAGKWKSFEDDLLYCISQAYHSIGDTQKANELMAAILAKFPDSPYAAPAAASAG